MPPKRSKELCERMEDGVWDSVWAAWTLSSFAFGEFMQRPNCSDVATIFKWNESIKIVLGSCASGVLSWDDCKKSLLRIFTTRPLLDPYLKNEKIDFGGSAELCATAFKRMLFMIRKGALYDDKRRTLLRKCSNDNERATLLELINMIKADAPGTDDDCLIVSPAKKLKEHISLESDSSFDFPKINLLHTVEKTADIPRLPLNRQKKQGITKKPSMKTCTKLPNGWHYYTKIRASGHAKGQSYKMYSGPNGIIARSMAEVLRMSN